MKAFLLLLSAGLTASNPLGQSASRLSTPKDVSLHVDISATIKEIPPAANFSALDPSSVSRLPDKQATGSYQISAQYRAPIVEDRTRADTLQILVHGLLFTGLYWTGPVGVFDQHSSSLHSWVDFASHEGYATLTIDRLCNGKSSHPDGLEECQMSVQLEVLHQIIEAARSGKVGGRTFRRIIVAGHSWGSLLTTALLGKYPADVDVAVLTAYSTHTTLTAAGANIPGAYAPAATVHPDRFKDLSPYYLSANNQSVYKHYFYHGQYSQEVALRDYDMGGTQCLGEVLTIYQGEVAARNFKGDLIALNGQNDDIFCERSGHAVGDCGNGSDSYTAQIKTLYPGVRSFQWANINDTGHAINYHYTALQEFVLAHQYLAAQGY